MDKEVFLDRMMELLDLEEEPSMDDELDNFDEWDSLGYITFLSMANKVSATRIPPEKVQDAKIIADLYALVKKG